GSGARRTLKDSKEFSLQCGLNQKALRVGGWDKTCPCVDRALWRCSSISSPILRNSAASQGCSHGDVYICLTMPLDLLRVKLLERVESGTIANYLLVCSKGKGVSHISVQLQSEVKRSEERTKHT
ncbi:hypothetical protein E2I00_019065, partial [Balaenoptera physalus]